MCGWQLRKLCLVALLALPLAAANFAYVQSASAPGGSVAFASNNTSGDAIVATVYGYFASPSISDTQGNTYVSQVVGLNIQIWIATNVKSGANTVSLTGGSCCISPYGGRGIVIAEYSSVSSNYCAAPGTAPPSSTTVVSGGAFRSANETIALIAGSTSGSSDYFGSWGFATGTIRNGVTPIVFILGTSIVLGDDDVSSVLSNYSNIVSQPYGVYSNAVAFLSLSCGVTSSSFTFPILY